MYKRGTDNYNFPRWDFDEHPDFLDDINPAFEKLDKVVHRIEVESADSADALATLTPIVEGLTEDVTDAKHDITDLQTRVTNEEHTTVDYGKRIESLEEHDKDIDATLYGFDENDPVKTYIDNLEETLRGLISTNTPYYWDTTFLPVSLTEGAVLTVEIPETFKTDVIYGTIQLVDDAETSIKPISDCDQFTVRIRIGEVRQLEITLLKDITISGNFTVHLGLLRR